MDCATPTTGEVGAVRGGAPYHVVHAHATEQALVRCCGACLEANILVGGGANVGRF